MKKGLGCMKLRQLGRLIINICIGLLILFTIGCGGGGDGNSGNALPDAQIVLPVDGSDLNAGDAITFAGSCQDREDGDLSGTSLEWTSDLDGAIGTGASFVTDALSIGTHQITLTGTDADGGTDIVTVTVTVVPNAAPVTQITQPASNSTFDTSDSITFSGSSTDREDGNLTGTALVWTSDLDGEIGIGETLVFDTLSVGIHQIALTGTDDKGETSTTSITITIIPAKRWTHPADLTEGICPNGPGVQMTQVAMDDSGDAIIAWVQGSGSAYHTYMSEYRGGVWFHPATVDDNFNPRYAYAGRPQIAMDGAGNAMVVWFQSMGTMFQVYKSEYRNEVWNHPLDLADHISPDGSPASYPHVAMDSAGSAVVVWNQRAGPIGANDQIFMSEFRNGSWQHPTGLNDNISLDAGSAGRPHVAMDAIGNAIIVWAQSDGVNSRIFKSEYRNNTWTHPTDPTDAISPDGTGASSPQVAMDGAGNAVVVWRQGDGADRQIFMSEFRNAIWYHPVDLDDNISPDGSSAEYPQVAMDDAGNTIIVWSQEDGTARQIFLSTYRDDVWIHPADLTDNISPDGGSADNPQVAMDDIGNAIVVWDQSTGPDRQIFMSEYREGTWRHPVDLSDNISLDASSATLPQVAMDASGNAVVIWQQSDGANVQIFKSEYR